MSEKNQTEKKGNKKKVIIILLILFLIGVAAYILHEGPTEVTKNLFDLTQDPYAQEGGIEKRSKEEIVAELNKKVEDGMINISMNTSPIFENGKSEGNLLIVNNDVNKYPQVIEIFHEDELIYKSGGIPVGSRIEHARLSVDLPKGKYKCVAYFNAVDPETNKLVGKAGANITITIKN